MKILISIHSSSYLLDAYVKQGGGINGDIPHLLTVNDGGQGGIRTLGDIAATHAFQACSFDHSDTCPSEGGTLGTHQALGNPFLKSFASSFFPIEKTWLNPYSFFEIPHPTFT